MTILTIDQVPSELGTQPVRARAVSRAPTGGNKEFLVIIAMLMAIAVLTINMILPAFDQIKSQFGLTDISSAGLTVSLLYLGLALGQIILGPLSDKLGRRDALTFGMSIFLVGSMIAGMAPSFEVLLVGQIVQGFGLGAPRVITLAILRDRFSGNEMARAMSFVMIMFVIAPTFAPSIGQAIVSAAGWQFLFVVNCVLGVGLVLVIRFRLPETLPADRRRTFNMRSTAHTYFLILKNKPAVGYAAALGIISGPFIAYLNMSQYIYEFQYQLGTAYPIIFAVLSLWIGAASLANGMIVRKLGTERLVLAALISIILASFSAIATINSGSPDLPFAAFIVYMGLVLFGFGLLVSNLNALAMANLSQSAGAGAAFIGALTTTISVVVAVSISELFSNSTASLAMGFLVCGLLSLAIHLAVQTRNSD